MNEQGKDHSPHIQAHPGYKCRKIILVGNNFGNDPENSQGRELDHKHGDLHHHLKDGIECFCKCLFMGFFHFRNKESEQNRKKDDRQHLIVVECLKYILGYDIDQSLPQGFLAFRQPFYFMAEVKVSAHARPDDINQELPGDDGQ